MPVNELPVGLPQLKCGRHARLEDGACLMEYVSVLAGEAFSDRPACVDDLLIRAAWWTNDTLADQTRPELSLLAPRFIGTKGLGPRLAPTLVGACSAFALPLSPPRTAVGLELMMTGAQARLRRLAKHPAGRRSKLSDRYYRVVHAEVDLRRIIEVVARADHRFLPEVLDVALSAAEEMSSASGAGANPAGSRTPPFTVR